MSKVSGGSADALAQLKEQYSVREREREDRHREEIREVREQHRAEIDKVRADTNKQVQTLHNDNSSKLNERDLQYQKEIESLRNLYSKRVSEGKKP